MKSSCNDTSDNTSLINCMQQLHLNLTRSHLSPAGCNKAMDVNERQPWSSDFVVFSISATVERRDLCLWTIYQLIKPIALLQGNLSSKLLYYKLWSVSARDETYSYNNGRHFDKLDSSFDPRHHMHWPSEVRYQIACKFRQRRQRLIKFKKCKLALPITFNG